LSDGWLSGWDAAWPPTAPPRGDFVAGYIGGNTPHIWSVPEWDTSLKLSGARYRLPIFTRSHDGDPRADAAFCADWAARAGQPKGTLLALDYETRVDATYLRTFDADLGAAGWRTIVYGSLSYVLKNPRPSGGYWTAEWTNVRHLNAGATITQYGGLATYDLNVADPAAAFWDITGGAPVILGTDDIGAIKNAIHDDVAKMLSDSTHYYLPPLHTKLAAVLDALGVLQTDEDRTQAAIALLATGGLTAQQIVDAVTTASPALAQAVNDEFARRQAS